MLVTLVTLSLPLDRSAFLVVFTATVALPREVGQTDIRSFGLRACVIFVEPKWKAYNTLKLTSPANIRRSLLASSGRAVAFAAFAK